MLTVSEVLKQGMEAYQQSRSDCPYEDNHDTHHKVAVQTISRRGCVGTPHCRVVRIDINWKEIWQLGWNLAEYLAEHSASR